MLGYDIEDLNIMRDMVDQSTLYIPPAQEGITIGLNMVKSFLDGLWSEGYFDQTLVSPLCYNNTINPIERLTMQFQVIRETTTTHTTIVEADSLESANDFARINNDELSWDLSSSDSYFSSFDVE